MYLEHESAGVVQDVTKLGQALEEAPPVLHSSELETKFHAQIEKSLDRVSHAIEAHFLHVVLVDAQANSAATGLSERFQHLLCLRDVGCPESVCHTAVRDAIRGGVEAFSKSQEVAIP